MGRVHIGLVLRAGCRVCGYDAVPPGSSHPCTHSYCIYRYSDCNCLVSSSSPPSINGSVGVGSWFCLVVCWLSSDCIVCLLFVLLCSVFVLISTLGNQSPPLEITVSPSLFSYCCRVHILDEPRGINPRLLCLWQARCLDRFWTDAEVLFCHMVVDLMRRRWVGG